MRIAIKRIWITLAIGIIVSLLLLVFEFSDLSNLDKESVHWSSDCEIVIQKKNEELEKLEKELRLLKHRLVSKNATQPSAVILPANGDGRQDTSASAQPFAPIQQQRKIVRIKHNVYSKETKTLLQEQRCDVLRSYLRHQIALSELVTGAHLHNEYEVVPYLHFTLSKLYSTELGLGKRVVEKPIGNRRKDLIESVTRSLEALNKSFNSTQRRFTADNFIEGAHRTVAGISSQYDLYFRTANQIDSFYKVTLVRPFSHLTVVSVDRQEQKEVINLIVPLSGRIESFRQFVERFSKVRKYDAHVTLCVVHFGDDGVNEVMDLVRRLKVDEGGGGVVMVQMDEPFSRGRALQAGVEKCQGNFDNKTLSNASPPSDALLFFCDVDVAFSGRFLERCRWNTSKGKSLYYPIVFSLYNPRLVYEMQNKSVPRDAAEQLLISKETGFWRDFGYGMTCQYRSDFLRNGGFENNPDDTGWGGEDVLLYRKHIGFSLKVIRIPDPGIFHLWHPKECPKYLSPDQYQACLTSKALNEASHAQMGLLAFKILDV